MSEVHPRIYRCRLEEWSEDDILDLRVMTKGKRHITLSDGKSKSHFQEKPTPVLEAEAEFFDPPGIEFIVTPTEYPKPYNQRV